MYCCSRLKEKWHVFLNSEFIEGSVDTQVWTAWYVMMKYYSELLIICPWRIIFYASPSFIDLGRCQLAFWYFHHFRVDNVARNYVIQQVTNVGCNHISLRFLRKDSRSSFYWLQAEDFTSWNGSHTDNVNVPASDGRGRVRSEIFSVAAFFN